MFLKTVNCFQFFWNYISKCVEYTQVSELSVKWFGSRVSQSCEFFIGLLLKGIQTIQKILAESIG